MYMKYVRGDRCIEHLDMVHEYLQSSPELALLLSAGHFPSSLDCELIVCEGDSCEKIAHMLESLR